MNADEKRGYGKGYAAGLKRRKKNQTSEQRQRILGENWNRAFLALLPTAMTADGWTIGGKAVTDADDRVRLAKLGADLSALTMKVTR